MINLIRTLFILFTLVCTFLYISDLNMILLLLSISVRVGFSTLRLVFEGLYIKNSSSGIGLQKTLSVLK